MQFRAFASCRESSWSSVIVEHVRQGKFQQALVIHRKLQEANFQPNEYAIAALLRACSELKEVNTGFKIHTDVIQEGLMESDHFVGNTLVNMYMKFGLLTEAQAAFNGLPARDVVSWNILLSGFIKHDCGEEVLNLFKLMQCKKVSPNNVTFVSILKACGLVGALNEGQQIHEQVARRGLLERDLTIGNALLDMYIKCGSLALAKEVFNKLAVRDVVSWNELMVAFVKQEYPKEVLGAFEKMQLEGLCPDSVTFVCLLKASGLAGATYHGTKIHARVAMIGPSGCDHVVINALLDMYATCGDLNQASQLLKQGCMQNVISWTSLIAGYTKYNHNIEALFSFDQMQCEGVFPNAATHVCALKACGSLQAICKGQEIHAKVSMLVLLEGNTYLGTSLVDMYAKCGMPRRAQGVFDRLKLRDTASWNALIGGYAQNKLYKEAFSCLEKMQLARVPQDAVTLVCGLKACRSAGSEEKVANFEFEIYRKGLLHDVIIGNALISFYLNSGLYYKAQELFESLPKPDVTSWTAMMGYYVKQDQGEVALHCFNEMQAGGLFPDGHAFVCSLKSCGILGALDKGKEIHAELENTGLLETNAFVCCALLDMYFKCGWAVGAQKLFDKLPVRDVVLWTAWVGGYADYARSSEALSAYENMDAEGAFPDVVAVTHGLKACGIAGAVGKGLNMHAELAARGLLEIEQPILGNALVNMYTNWGYVEHAEEVLHKMVVRDISSWNLLISGYSQQGDIENVFRILREMIAAGEMPNQVTFVGILNACGRTGLVNKGKTTLAAMNEEHGIAPNLKHYACMIDVLNHAGHLDLSADVITNLPSHKNPSIWHSTLNARLQFTCVDSESITVVNKLQNGLTKSVSSVNKINLVDPKLCKIC